jgi:chemotaxis protein CheD
MKEPVNEIYLQPGEYFWGGERNRVKTLLGSCVAICIWHPRFKIGGMSHCLLPSRGHGGPRVGERKDAQEPTGGHGGPRVGERTDAKLSGKYVDECLEIFFREMVRAGTRKQDYVVKVFGGGNMFELKDPSGATVGERNIEMLKAVLAREGIAIAAQHLGGKGHRNVIFELWNGDCWVKHAELLLPTAGEKP